MYLFARIKNNLEVKSCYSYIHYPSYFNKTQTHFESILSYVVNINIIFIVSTITFPLPLIIYVNSNFNNPLIT